MITWYLIGLAGTSLFVYLANSYFDIELKVGDVAFALLMAIGGPLTIAALILLGIALGIMTIADMKIWKKSIKDLWK